MTLRRGAKRLLGQLPPPPRSLYDSLVVKKNSKAMDIDISKAKALWFLAEDAGSYDPDRTVAAWLNLEVEGPSGVKRLRDLATLSKLNPRELKVDKNVEPDALVAEFSKAIVVPIEGLGFTRLHGRVGIDDSSLSSDIGPAVRFFVFAEQPDREQMVAVNGGAAVAFPRPAASKDELIDRLYWQTLARAPGEAEKAVALKILGSGDVGGLEDLLWSLLLHPEMQYLN